MRIFQTNPPSKTPSIPSQKIPQQTKGRKKIKKKTPPKTRTQSKTTHMPTIIKDKSNDDKYTIITTTTEDKEVCTTSRD